MIGERKHVSKEVKEQRKFKSMLHEKTVWVSCKIIEKKIKDPKTGVEINIHNNVPVQGTYNVGRNAAKRAAKSIIVK